jgi:glycosyltransferase involved in cell wall biosynthesis
MRYKISVIISTYNDRAFVEKKIAEIKQQSIFDDAEFIFIEPDSPQQERELIAPLCEQHPNCKLVALDERVNLFRAWNIGWQQASAPIVCYSNMDDSMHPRLLEHVVTGMNAHRWDVCTVLTARQLLSSIATEGMWSLDSLKAMKLFHRPGAFTAWRASLRDTIGEFDDAYYAAGDKEFWGRIVDRGVNYGLIRKILYIYSKSEHQLSKSPQGYQGRQQDKERLLQTGYRRFWPYRVFPTYFFLRLVFRLYPRRYYVPPV